MWVNHGKHFRISKFGTKKQNGEEDSVVELTSCIIEVLQGFNSGILIQLYLYLHLYLYEQVEGELLTIQCDNAGSLELARETLQQFFSKPPAPKPEVTVARLVHFLYSLESIFSALQVMLSRVEILSLAASPSSMSAPKNWVSLNFLRIAFLGARIRQSMQYFSWTFKACFANWDWICFNTISDQSF